MSNWVLSWHRKIIEVSILLVPFCGLLLSIYLLIGLMNGGFGFFVSFLIGIAALIGSLLITAILFGTMLNLLEILKILQEIRDQKKP